MRIRTIPPVAFWPNADILILRNVPTTVDQYSNDLVFLQQNIYPPIVLFEPPKSCCSNNRWLLAFPAPFCHHRNNKFTRNALTASWSVTHLEFNTFFGQFQTRWEATVTLEMIFRRTIVHCAKGRVFFASPSARVRAVFAMCLAKAAGNRFWSLVCLVIVWQLESTSQNSNVTCYVSSCRSVDCKLNMGPSAIVCGAERKFSFYMRYAEEIFRTSWLLWYYWIVWKIW